MNRKSLFVGIISLITVIVFLSKPEELIKSAAEGLVICSKIVIPSLFPFTAVILFLFNSGILNVLSNSLSTVTRIIFGLNGNAFLAVITSFVGGYPVGAKITNQLKEQKLICENTAKRMLYYSVNPGPAFVIIGIGKGMFNRIDIGIIIYVSNVVSSIILCLYCSIFERKEKTININTEKSFSNISDIFVNSVADATSAVISICGFVILFSAIIGIIESITPNTDQVIALLEVSNGTIIFKNNIYAISFLTAFAGFCVHAQILSVCKSIKINYFIFLIARISSGVISLLTTYILVKIFKPTMETLSLTRDYTIKLSADNLILSAILIFMSVTLLVSIKQKYVEK